MKGRVLIRHPTGHKKDFWSIPKCKIEKVETNFQGAMRETQEECNVDLKYVELQMLYELPKVNYKHGKKCLYPFVVMECNNELDFSEFEIKCNAIVPEGEKWNAGKPEFDDFKWLSLDEAKKLLHDTQAKCIDNIKHIFKDDC